MLNSPHSTIHTNGATIIMSGMGADPMGPNPEMGSGCFAALSPGLGMLPVEGSVGRAQIPVLLLGSHIREGKAGPELSPSLTLFATLSLCCKALTSL